MQRGARNLFSSLLENDEPEVITAQRNSGRSTTLIQKRDVKLVHRHYYYLKIQKLQYPDILANLSLEFDLAEYTITERLQIDENYRMLRGLIKEGKPVSELRKAYPFFVWQG